MAWKLLELQAVYSDARSWLSVREALILVGLVGVLTVWSERARLRRLRSAFSVVVSWLLTSRKLAFLLLLVVFVIWVVAVPLSKRWLAPETSPQVHELAIATEGTCEALPDSDSGDVRISSQRGPCKARQVDPHPRTKATPTSFSVVHDVHQRKSTPGTGVEILGELGEARSLTARQRGWGDGRLWCLEISESVVNQASGALETQMLRKRDPCVQFTRRPDRVKMGIKYDGSHFQVFTKFMTDLSGGDAVIGTPQIVKILHSRPRAQKFLALISTSGQLPEDLLAIKSLIPSYWWQKDDEE